MCLSLFSLAFTFKVAKTSSSTLFSSSFFFFNIHSLIYTIPISTHSKHFCKSGLLLFSFGKFKTFPNFTFVPPKVHKLWIHKWWTPTNLQVHKLFIPNNTFNLTDSNCSNLSADSIYLENDLEQIHDFHHWNTRKKDPNLFPMSLSAKQIPILPIWNSKRSFTSLWEQFSTCQNFHWPKMQHFHLLKYEQKCPNSFPGTHIVPIWNSKHSDHSIHLANNSHWPPPIQHFHH